MNTILNEMIGTTITEIDGKIGDSPLIFHAIDGTQFIFEHYQDCCESVQIEDIIGDLSDLIGYPLVEAEECSSEEPTPVYNYESYTWTFYRFVTAKGTVTIRWLGLSNGYYSESVNYSVIKPKEQV